jgi:ribosome biogenesis protein UTP30
LLSPYAMAVASTSDLIDEHVSAAQCSKAVESLLKHSRAHQEKQDESELLPGAEPHVWLVLAVKKMVPEKKLKPFRMYVFMMPPIVSAKLKD